MIWNLPNILTILRLAAAPGIALAFLFLPHPVADWAALIFFAAASVTDFLDGYLARKWNQTSRFGAMLDPIADKAMVVIALMVICVLFGLSFWIVFPTTFILFREVFVSGLREFLGTTAGLLKVTKLAKWKTTAQMVAIVVLISNGLFVHYFGMGTMGMDREMIGAVLSGRETDLGGIGWKHQGMNLTYFGGVALLWVAAVLTVITGADYLRKAMPFLREDAA